MQNDMRDRLVELVDDYIHYVDVKKWYSEELDEGLADHLIANGVTISPLTVGDMVDKWFSHNETVAIWHDKKR